MASKRQIDAGEARKVGTTLGLDWTKVDLQQFRRGLEVEFEHGVPWGTNTRSRLALAAFRSR